jgi:hypothetical protein
MVLGLVIQTSTALEREQTMKKLTVNGSWVQFLEPLRKLEPFKTHGSLRGEPVTFPSQISQGRLDPKYFPSLHSYGTDYVIYSYATPLAWHDSERGWTMPDERYSVTTSKQQGRIATAISVLEHPVPERHEGIQIGNGNVQINHF